MSIYNYIHIYSTPQQICTLIWVIIYVYMYTYTSNYNYLCYMFLCYKWVVLKNFKVIVIVSEEDINQGQQT